MKTPRAMWLAVALTLASTTGASAGEWITIKTSIVTDLDCGKALDLIPIVESAFDLTFLYTEVENGRKVQIAKPNLIGTIVGAIGEYREKIWCRGNEMIFETQFRTH